MHELVGKRLGDFEISASLAGAVWALSMKLAATIAESPGGARGVLGSGLGLTAKAVERFQREAEAAAKLHHTNIVLVYARPASRTIRIIMPWS